MSQHVGISLRGYKTFFLTGTDEHGQKVAEAASKHGNAPQEFVDSFINDFKQTWDDYDISMIISLELQMKVI